MKRLSLTYKAAYEHIPVIDRHDEGYNEYKLGYFKQVEVFQGFTPCCNGYSELDKCIHGKRRTCNRDKCPCALHDGFVEEQFSLKQRFVYPVHHVNNLPYEED